MLANQHVSNRDYLRFAGILAGICLLAAIVAFSNSLTELVGRWIKQEEYGHGFLIPVLTAWLLWTRRDAILESMGKPSWLGPIVVAAALILHLIGELSAMFLFSQVAFIVALTGIILCAGGFALLRITAVPVAFLLFAIPLPYFLESVLTWRLQIVSSELGAYFIRLLGIPVFLEGNIIDLGNYKVQVVEACSGLRYLYPLLGLSFLAAYFFQAPLWQRALVFLSAVPITILMNSLRIAAVGVMVNYWGSGMAEGMMHLFEGWIVFLMCAALLVAEIYVLVRLTSDKTFYEVFGLPEVSPVPQSGAPRSQLAKVPLAACLMLLLAGTLGVQFLSGRQETVPDRARFAEFPSRLGDWSGRLNSLSPDVERGLGVDDYILSDYDHPDGELINLYVAYYASQRKGVSPHSPIVCMPGGGWQIVQFDRTAVPSYEAGGKSPINRAVIERGRVKQLVYYWFVQRGRPVANEYWSKWYLFTDAIFKNRTDGALVRLTTPLAPGEPEREADARLQSFLQELNPRLTEFLPPPSERKIQSVSNRLLDASM
jgi:exosortase D (VPLPA-CTERM-specific)